MARITFSQDVPEDIGRIYRYIEPNNPKAAKEILKRINLNVTYLAEFPEIGIARNDIRVGCRMLIVRGYRILYEYTSETDTVFVLRVIEPYRDLHHIVF